MGTPRKQFHEGYWYHVYARSIPEVYLFKTNDEREWFIEKLDTVFTRRQVGLGAVCLMDTHYHALAKMGPIRLDRALNSLHMSYAKHVNSERDRRSSVFATHPGTDIVLDDAYLLQLVPYIHQNPIKAGIVSDPRNYEWHTDGLYRGSEWVHGSLECWDWPPYFKGSDRARVYKERMDEEPEIPRSDDGYIGTEDEWSELEKRDADRKERFSDRRDRQSIEEIAESHVTEKELSVEDLKEPGRKQPEARIRQDAMIEMYEEGYGPTEIGDYFNRDKGTVLYAVRTYGNEK